ncbi:MAG: hypothetical protein ACI30H_03875 [Paludibacteraceae bacterium]
MKKLILFACALCMSVCAMAQTVFFVYKTDGTSVQFAIADVDSISFSGHEYVDLGLPSGLKWATCNVGATAPEEYGDHYAWGETAPKSSYSSDNYSYSDNPNVLPLDKDAARANWGGQWRMPTKEEWQELLDNCTWTWVEGYNGGENNGYNVTGSNGNSIFLPAAGYRNLNSLSYKGEYGYYWSSLLDTDNTDNAWDVFFRSDNVSKFSNNRCYGRSIRPVSK